MNTKFHYGWKPDVPDHRDLYYAVKAPRKLPSQVDLRTKCPPVLNQGQLGSCTANAIASAHQFCQLLADPKHAFAPSRLFVYFNEREMEGSILQDSGAVIRDGFKSIAKQGVCPESMWAYNDGPIAFRIRPSAACYKEALNHQAIEYRRLVQTESQVLTCLAEGFPFVFGFTVYESFESSAVAKSGIAPMPAKSEKALGGHAVKCVGFTTDLAKVHSRKDKLVNKVASPSGIWLIVKNSWGEGWGDRGYFYMPLDYVLNDDLAADLWTLRRTE